MTATPDEIGVYLPLIVAVAVTLATIVIHDRPSLSLFTMCRANRSSAKPRGGF